MFVRAGQSSFMYEFSLYSGINGANKADCSCQNVVLRLCEGIQRQ